MARYWQIFVVFGWGLLDTKILGKNALAYENYKDQNIVAEIHIMRDMYFCKGPIMLMFMYVLPILIT
jgi:hypothetical protein